MTTSRRDMLTLLPIAMAPAALPPSIPPALSACARSGPDAALIAQCEAFVRIDRETMNLNRQMNIYWERDEEPPEEMEAALHQLDIAKPSLNKLGETPAATMDGLKAKARAQLEELCRHDDGQFEDDDRMIGGILLDLLRLT